MGRNFHRRSESFLGEENYDDGEKNYLTQVIQRKIEKIKPSWSIERLWDNRHFLENSCPLYGI